MPREYNFDQLSPREFEFLGRDLIQKRIRAEGDAAFFFKSFPEGRDNGIDAVFHDENSKIILQCKRYKNFDQLLSTLKNSEFSKVKKLKPTRYLLCVSCSLTKVQTEKIFNQFKGYIHSISDIVDSLMLNSLLDEFPEVELNYPKLYLASSTTLSSIFHADVYNQSSLKLRHFHELIDKFVAGQSFQHALDILVKHHYLIISGEPGVGKFMTAGMLSLYFTEQGYEFIFIRKKIAEATGAVWKKDQKQIFFFDDFLGSTTFEGFDRNEDRELLDFINSCANSTDKLLIITTREYVFRQAELKYPELRELNYHKCFIWQKQFTNGFKINILYNYLYHSKIEWNHIEPLLHNDNYERLIYHNNFTPRLLSEYINKHYDSNGSSYSLFLGLKKYLDDPYIYWEGVFKKLSDAAQMLMLIISITAEPALEWIIFKTFCSAGKRRQLYKTGYEQDAYNDALAELSDSFISILHNPTFDREKGLISSRDLSLITMSFGQSRYIEFQNPSIKDFIISYLRKREDLQSILVNSAVVFNQFYFAFTTNNEKERLEDEEFEYSYTAPKILLPVWIHGELMEKGIKEFDELPIAKVRRISWTEGVDSFHLNEEAFDNRMLRLWELCLLFPLAEYPVVRSFVIKKYQQILKGEEEYRLLEIQAQIDSPLRPLSLDERIYQVDIVKKITPYVSLDPVLTIKRYYENIRFAKEFLMIESFKEIFPEAYCQVITSNIKDIRTQIKKILIDDIDHYLWEGTHEAHEALDHLLDMELEQLEETYKVKFDARWKKQVNDITGREIFYIEKKSKEPRSIVASDDKQYEYVYNDKEDKQIYKSYQCALMRLKPIWIKRHEGTQTNYLKYITSTQEVDKGLAEQIRLFANKHDSDLLYSRESANALYLFFSNLVIKTPQIKDFYEYMLSTCNLSQEKLASLIKCAFELTLNGVDIFRKSTFADSFLQGSNEPINEEIINELLSCILIKQDDIWYSFLSVDFQCYLTAMHINSFDEGEKKEFYCSLNQVHDNIDSKYLIPLWKHNNEFDTENFTQDFINPALYAELGQYQENAPEKLAIDYLKKRNYEFSYEYDQEEKYYMFDRGSEAGNPLIEDIIEYFGENRFMVFDALENSFNISDSGNPVLHKYIKKYCMKADGTYEININKEISRGNNFIYVLHACGAITVVNHYFDWLKKQLQ